MAKMFNLLDKRLPRMHCPDGCGDCCGMIQVCEWEGRQIAAYIVREQITPMKQGTTCPFFQDGRCAIYPVRPVVCRLYGHIPVDLMTCPHGYNVNIKPALVDRLNNEYRDSARGNTALLHALVYSEAEAKAMLKAAMRVREANLAAIETAADGTEKPPNSLIMVPAAATQGPAPKPVPENQPERKLDEGFSR
jgi:hypothetical protein